MQPQQAGQSDAHLIPRNDGVNKTLVLQILSRLKVIRQLFAQCLFNDTTPREPDQGLGFSKDQISQHGEAGCDPTCGGMRQQWHVKQLRVSVALQRTGDFGHLHKAEHPLLHASTAGGTNNQQRQAFLRRHLNEASDHISLVYEVQLNYEHSFKDQMDQKMSELEKDHQVSEVEAKEESSK